jgi:hypothetical protein
LQTLYAQNAESYAKVANRVVELFNAGDYSGVHDLFNKEMSNALPLNKAADFLGGLKSQLGKIRRWTNPGRGRDGRFFRRVSSAG